MNEFLRHTRWRGLCQNFCGRQLEGSYSIPVPDRAERCRSRTVWGMIRYASALSTFQSMAGVSSEGLGVGGAAWIN